ncbi:transposase, mutator type [Rhodococcus wratislaviensis IFP 2016]|nr:transposase, mutator type [Rhodococcus wratislaviensis IFP 2016]
MFAEPIRAGLQELKPRPPKPSALAITSAPRPTTHRNGNRPKTVSTTSGDVELKIPKLLSGSFFPSLLERSRRIDKALHAVIMEAYVHGVSTHSVVGVCRGSCRTWSARLVGHLRRLTIENRGTHYRDHRPSHGAGTVIAGHRRMWATYGDQADR